MKTEVRHIITFLDQWAPPGTKMDFDNVGLLVGSPEAEVTKILTCLDVTDEVVDEAIAGNCELIVAHHPLIFSKIGSITPDNEQGRIIYKLIKHDIALLVYHTNLDAALDGVSFVLANLLGLDNLKFLSKEYAISKKIQLVTDYDDAGAVLRLLNYYSAEEAHHYPVENREKGIRCFEAIIDNHHVAALKKELKREGLLKSGGLQVTELNSPSRNFGMGVIGRYPDEGVGQQEFLHLVSKALNVRAIRYSGKADRIKKVAVCGGSGIFLKNKAIAGGADAFVTADIKYHDYFTEQKNFLLVDVGHYESEFPVAEALKNELSEAFEHIQVRVTSVITNPMKTYVSEYKHQTIQTSL